MRQLQTSVPFQPCLLCLCRTTPSFPKCRCTSTSASCCLEGGQARVGRSVSVMYSTSGNGKLTALHQKGCYLTTHHTRAPPLPLFSHRCPPVLHPCLVQMRCSWTGHRRTAPRCMWWTCGMAAAAHSPRRPALCFTGPTHGRARMAGARWLHIWPAVLSMGALPPGHCFCRKAPAPPPTAIAPACRALPQPQPAVLSLSPSRCALPPSAARYLHIDACLYDDPQICNDLYLEPLRADYAPERVPGRAYLRRATIDLQAADGGRGRTLAGGLNGPAACGGVEWGGTDLVLVEHCFVRAEWLHTWPRAGSEVAGGWQPLVPDEVCPPFDFPKVSPLKRGKPYR